MTRDLGEAAAGGQVLLSHAVWERLRGAMAAAGFPVVRSLGCFRLPSSPAGAEPLWVYEVSRSALTPGLERAAPGGGAGVVGSALTPPARRGPRRRAFLRRRPATCWGGPCTAAAAA